MTTLPGVSPVVKIAGGDNHTVFRLANGDVYVSGDKAMTNWDWGIIALQTGEPRYLPKLNESRVLFYKK